MYKKENKLSWFNPPVSPYKDKTGSYIKANQTPNGNLSLEAVSRWIKGEGTKNKLKSLTDKLRSITDSDPKKEHELRGDYKKTNLPFVTFGGEFSYRTIKNLTNPSGLICLDIDGDDQTPTLNYQDIDPLIQRFSEDEELDPVLIFRSPTGAGIKLVVPIRQDITGDGDFKSAYRSLERYLSERYDIKTDPQRKDIAGACFLCYDPNVVFRTPSGEGFDMKKWEPVKEEKPVNIASQKPLRETMGFSEVVSDYERALIAVEDIERSGIDITSDREQWRRIGFALTHLGKLGRELFHRVSQFYPRYSREETDNQFSSFLRSEGTGVELESLFAIAKEHGVSLRSSDVYLKQRQALTKGQQKQTSKNSEQEQQSEPTQDEIKERLSFLLRTTTEEEIISKCSQLSDNLPTGYSVEGKNGTPQRLLLLSGKLTEIAGATGHGKTLFLLNLLLNVSRMNPEKRFVLFTYEETEEAILEYLLNIYLDDLNLMRVDDDSNRVLIDRYFRGEGINVFNPESQDDFKIRKNLFFKKYIETGRIVVRYIEETSTELSRDIEYLSQDSSVGGVFVDYFQYINPDPNKRFPTRQEALKSICIELKDVANKTGFPVVLACQFNQEVLSPTDVLLNRIGEAGDISRIGSECWGLWQMGKDIGRDLSNSQSQIYQSLEAKSESISSNDSFTKGMFIKVLKSRIIETGSDVMLTFRGLTGKIYPNDTKEKRMEGKEWEGMTLTPSLEFEDLPEN